MSLETDDARKIVRKALDQMQDGVTKITITDLCKAMIKLCDGVDRLRAEQTARPGSEKRPMSKRITRRNP